MVGMKFHLSVHALFSKQRTKEKIPTPYSVERSLTHASLFAVLFIIGKKKQQTVGSNWDPIKEALSNLLHLQSVLCSFLS